MDGISTREPAFGLPAWWISPDQRERATTAAYTVVDPTTTMSTHLSETIRTFLPDLLGRQQIETRGPCRPDVTQAGRGPFRSSCRLATSAGAAPAAAASACRFGTPRPSSKRLLTRPAPRRIPTRSPRPSAPRDGTGDLPAIPERSRRTAGHQPGARAGVPARGALVRTEQRRGARARPSAHAQRLASRVADALTGAVAQPVLLCTPMLRSAPVAAVHSGVALACCRTTRFHRTWESPRWP